MSGLTTGSLYSVNLFKLVHLCYPLAGFDMTPTPSCTFPQTRINPTCKCFQPCHHPSPSLLAHAGKTFSSACCLKLPYVFTAEYLRISTWKNSQRQMFWRVAQIVFLHFFSQPDAACTAYQRAALGGNDASAVSSTWVSWGSSVVKSIETLFVLPKQSHQWDKWKLPEVLSV